jgi:hypothetical protein
LNRSKQSRRRRNSLFGSPGPLYVLQWQRRSHLRCLGFLMFHQSLRIPHLRSSDVVFDSS